MKRHSVTSDQQANPEVAQALRLHAAERDQILQALIGSFNEDQRIRAAWLWGSFLKGNSDDLSDLDIWLIVADDAVSGLTTDMERYCSSAGTLVSGGENAHNSPKEGIYYGALLAGSCGLHHLDIYWQPSSLGILPEGSALLNRLDELPIALADGPSENHPVEASELEPCRRKIAFVWLMLSVAAKYLARDRSSDMSLLSYPKNSFNETVEILGIEAEIGDISWTASEDIPSKIALLRRVNAKTWILEEECRRRGLSLSAEANPCLARYIDLVEGILGFSD